jgi:hypothetical protein
MAKQTAAQRKASLRNLAKARRARKGGTTATKTKTTRRRARTATATPTRRRRRRSGATAKQRAAARRNLRKARAAVTTAGRRRGQKRRKPHRVKAYRVRGHVVRRHRVKAHRVRAHHSREASRRRGAMENPLGAGELITGMISGVLGFLAGDALDRTLATHALTDSGNKDANGFEVYTDTPATSGSYSGLYNAAAVLAPMNVTRWAAGLGLAALPLVGAQFVKGPALRAAFQFFGFGVGIRVLGKGLVDVASMMLKKTATAQRLYDAELRAQLAQTPANATTYPSLPTAGLGAAGYGCGCGQCAGCRGGGLPSSLMPPNVSPPVNQSQPQAPVQPPAPLNPTGTPVGTVPQPVGGSTPHIPPPAIVAPPGHVGTPMMPSTGGSVGPGGGGGFTVAPGGSPSRGGPNIAAPLPVSPRFVTPKAQTLQGRPPIRPLLPQRQDHSIG